MEKYDDYYLLMIEPKNIAEEPIEDELTRKTLAVWKNCTPSENAYRGFHRCICGETSSNRDYYTPKGRITNNLIVHYIKYHRSEVPKEEIQKLMDEYNG